MKNILIIAVFIMISNSNLHADNIGPTSEDRYQPQKTDEYYLWPSTDKFDPPPNDNPYPKFKDINDPPLNPKFAEPPFMPTFSVGFSYPFIVSASLGGMFLPVGNKPVVPALRADIEAGIGGGDVSAGMSFIVRDSNVINIKGALLRKWIISSDKKTFQGGIIDYASLGHSPLKIGVGFFKERAPDNNSGESFSYVFLGIG